MLGAPLWRGMSSVPTVTSTATAYTVAALRERLAAQAPGVAAHCDRVALLAARAGCAAGLGPDELTALVVAARLHEVGKIASPAPRGPHVLAGERLIAGLPGGAETEAEAARLVRWSHERFDGAGYPDRLVGIEIPRAAALLAACDAWDEMTSPRSGRDPLTPSEADRELERCSGDQFAPYAVEALLRSRARTRTLAQIGFYV
jgi:HD-GYP domain-containing protein (c-di-GMP phosphodiesterase class II)